MKVMIGARGLRSSSTMTVGAGMGSMTSSTLCTPAPFSRFSRSKMKPCLSQTRTATSGSMEMFGFAKMSISIRSLMIWKTFSPMRSARSLTMIGGLMTITRGSPGSSSSSAAAAGVAGAGVAKGGASTAGISSGGSEARRRFGRSSSRRDSTSRFLIGAAVETEAAAGAAAAGVSAGEAPSGLRTRFGFSPMRSRAPLFISVAVFFAALGAADSGAVFSDSAERDGVAFPWEEGVAESEPCLLVVFGFAGMRYGEWLHGFSRRKMQPL